VRDPAGWKVTLPGAMRAASEVAARVIDDLVDVDGGMRVRTRDRVGMKVERSGDEARDERSARRERAVPRRR